MSIDPSGSVLIVDDEAGVRDLMTRWLESGGLAVRSASTAEEALDGLESDVPAVALCDIRMPGRDGLWLAERIRHQCPETAVIMATGVQDVAPAIACLRQGVVDYLTKPFGRDRLREAVSRGLEWHRAAWDARRWRETLEQETAMRRARLAEALAGLKIESDQALDAMLSMVTLSEREAYAHAHRVAAIAGRIGALLGLGADDLVTLERAALLHDLGKLAMPDAVLRKPAPLTVEENALIRQHPVIGSDLLAGVPFVATAADIVHDAHEWTDGRGRRRRATGAAALSARIIAVADAFDTMTHPRVFRDALAEADALVELERGRGTQFDPLVVDAFRRLLHRAD